MGNTVTPPLQGSFPGNAGNAGSQMLIDTASPKGLTSNLQSAGMSFGRLVASTGQAVADTQMRLNTTGAAMASALATTQVEVIAAQESIYDDDGHLHEARTFTRKLPLVNFIDPVFYEWTAVRLQGEFYASGFSGSASVTATTQTETKQPGSGAFGFIFGANKVDTQTNTVTATAGATTTQERSFGHVRASALLQPKRDIGVPPPRQVVRGPSLNVVAGEIKDVLAGTVLQARTMAVLIELRRADGSAIADKAIAIDTDGAPWSYADEAATVTDSHGRLAITLRRDFLAGAAPAAADTGPKDVILSARLGLVSNSSSLSF
jgi:hypothetical protein